MRYLNPFLLGISFILLHVARLSPPHRVSCSLDKQVGWCVPSSLHHYVALTFSLASTTSHCFPIPMTALWARVTVRPISCLVQSHRLSQRRGTDSRGSLHWWEIVQLGQPALQVDLEVSTWHLAATVPSPDLRPGRRAGGSWFSPSASCYRDKFAVGPVVSTASSPPSLRLL